MTEVVRQLSPWIWLCPSFTIESLALTLKMLSFVLVLTLMVSSCLDFAGRASPWPGLWCSRLFYSNALYRLLTYLLTYLLEYEAIVINAWSELCGVLSRQYLTEARATFHQLSPGDRRASTCSGETEPDSPVIRLHCA